MTAAANRYAFDARPLAPGVTLHLHATSKRKTNQLSIAWIGNLGEDVTERALIPALLLRGNQQFPSMREMAQRLEFLYGAALAGDVMKVGERHVVVLRGEVPNDRYLPRGETILADYLDFVAETIARPRLDRGAFPAGVLAQEKENHRRLIEGLLNDKRAYARERCLAEMCRDEAFRLYEYGRVEDLGAITGDGIAGLWRRNVAGAPAHVYFAGDFDFERAAAALAVLGAGRHGALLPVKENPPLRGAAETRRVEEEMDVKQAKLVFGFRTHIRFGDPLLEALSMANGILGVFPSSKLFLNVREAASLCYYASSTLDRTQGLMLIAAGIDAEKREQAEDLILAQVRDVQAGKFTDDELQATRLAFYNQLIMMEDNPRGLMDIDLTWSLAGVAYDHETYKRRLMEATRDEIVEAARKLELDTVYFLKPAIS